MYFEDSYVFDVVVKIVIISLYYYVYFEMRYKLGWVKNDCVSVY